MYRYNYAHRVSLRFPLGFHFFDELLQLSTQDCCWLLLLLLPLLLPAAAPAAAPAPAAAVAAAAAAAAERFCCICCRCAGAWAWSIAVPGAQGVCITSRSSEHQPCSHGLTCPAPVSVTKNIKHTKTPTAQNTPNNKRCC